MLMKEKSLYLNERGQRTGNPRKKPQILHNENCHPLKHAYKEHYTYRTGSN